MSRTPVAAPPSVLAGLRTDARRFELYVRLSLYVLLGFELLFTAGLVIAAAEGQWGAAVYAVGMVAQSALNIAVCRWALTSMRGADRRPRGASRALLVVWLALSAVLVATAPLLISVDFLWRLLASVVVLGPLAAICPMFNRRQILVSGTAAVVVLGVLLALGLSPDRSWVAVIGMVVSVSISVAALVFAFWTSGWMLRVVWALDDARGQAAQLAIAEERLRIARDLHDAFGRTLATVAVKSELAAELVRRGRSEQAATEIAAVRQIADDAGREVRHVVSGVRAADLPTELAGARALLDSAGIRASVSGDVPESLDPAVAAVLAWALREGVTNVIRHSRASWCRIALTDGSPVRLQIDNDGAVGPGDGRGNGLTGMSERLRTVGGQVDHRSGDGVFVLQIAAGPVPA